MQPASWILLSRTRLYTSGQCCCGLAYITEHVLNDVMQVFSISGFKATPASLPSTRGGVHVLLPAGFWNSPDIITIEPVKQSIVLERHLEKVAGYLLNWTTEYPNVLPHLPPCKQYIYRGGSITTQIYASLPLLLAVSRPAQHPISRHSSSQSCSCSAQVHRL